MDKTKQTVREFLEANGVKCPNKIDSIHEGFNAALSFLDQPMPVVDRTQEIEELAKNIKKIIRKVGFNHYPLAKCLSDIGYSRYYPEGVEAQSKPELDKIIMALDAIIADRYETTVAEAYIETRKEILELKEHLKKSTFGHPKEAQGKRDLDEKELKQWYEKNNWHHKFGTSFSDLMLMNDFLKSICSHFQRPAGMTVEDIMQVLHDHWMKNWEGPPIEMVQLESWRGQAQAIFNAIN